eukprot:TRINITY_DN4508_c0_g1_i1.p1 TRINITY_DN4508_c0_g1~~TRINITY_DN4508_c0_g1_i1.p1  ORF type:complete len:582 (-),score=104.09 TRINITY_DN4508_c0_g1_i1:949-2694(-)
MSEAGEDLLSTLATPTNTTVCVPVTELNVGGLVAIIIFYLVVLLVGLYAGWKRRQVEQNQEQVMLAGRDIGIFVGVLTMGATWVGGGFINGSAEAAYKNGLVWTLAPFGYSISLIISGTFFARRMRESEYVTMIDPFTQKYGRWGALQAIPAAISEVFWSASILGALGSTLQVILALNETASIILSAVIAVFYTLLGGLISVAYTDVVQMFFIVFGLFLALPFAFTNENVGNIYEEKLANSNSPAWYGRIEEHKVGEWIDEVFLLLCGGIPWQCYYQRVLSSKSASRAQYLSYGGAAIALIMTGPSVLFGAIGKATDWSAAGYPCDEPNSKVILPLALQYLTPPAVAFFGLGAVSAAVMSSTDSSMLSASTMLARNVYHKVLRPNCEEKEVLWALYVLIAINCFIATLLAIVYKSVYDLFVLCGDFMFVIVFPQLVFVLYWNLTNTYGTVSSFVIVLLFRFLVGDTYMKIAPTISFGTVYNSACFLENGDKIPDYDPKNCEGAVPFRMIVTLIGIIVHMAVAYGAHYLFVHRRLSLKYDFLKCFKKSGHEVVPRTSRHLKEEYQMSDFEKNQKGIANGGYS